MSQLAPWNRRGLHSPDLVIGSSELRLNPERTGCDLGDFTEARRTGALDHAAELYAGPFMDGFYLSDSPAFERWVESRRSALARDHQETLEALAVQAELRGETRSASYRWCRSMTVRRPRRWRRG